MTGFYHRIFEDSAKMTLKEYNYNFEEIEEISDIDADNWSTKRPNTIGSLEW